MNVSIIKTTMLGLFCFLSISSYGQAKYTFPPREEWEHLRTPFERKKALQIPQEELSKIPTNDLIDICMDYPYITDIVFSNSLLTGIDQLLIDFIGFTELIRRKDLGGFMVEKSWAYNDSLLSLPQKSEYEKGRFAFKCLLFELLLSRDEVIENLDTKQIRELTLSTVQRDSLKWKYTNVFGGYNFLSSCAFYVKQILRTPNYKYQNSIGREQLELFLINPIRNNPIANQEVNCFLKNIAY